ncbi:MAG: YCF48-related protein [Ignavibacteria bacterium]|nr:YCF48-related protein [Ignavibacteria bacterium]
MQRLFRLGLFLILLGFLTFDAYAQPQAFVSGRVAPDEIRIFVKDTIYVINRDYVIGGTLIIEPGTTILFYPNGRLIDSVGGRIIADGLASATYNANPGGLRPTDPPGSPSNPQSYDGYSDVNYFLHPGVVNVGTVRDLTIHSAKNNYMFGVIFNRNLRGFSNLPEVPGPLSPQQVILPFEYAIMFYAARLQFDPANDLNLWLYPWRRFGGRSVNITPARIRFIGQPDNNFSREWGHIVVLPGARAAFFRNCTFEGFRKDVTVGDKPFYGTNLGETWTNLNRELAKLTNGTGGAITSLSSRLWLINVEFRNNMARHRGGALALLQAPEGYPFDPIINTLPNYPSNKNPNYREKDGSISRILSNYPIKAYDLIDESTSEPLNSFQRQAIDDGRLALLLGRIRNVKFERNYVQLANVKTRLIGNPPVPVVTDATDEPAAYPQQYGNVAFGGAIYISGRNDQYGQDTRIEVGIGINNSVNTTTRGLITFPTADTYEAIGNVASNYQNHGNTFGARGGAIYVGANTSLIVAGKFISNETYVKYLQDSITGTNSGYFSRGGAIFCENTFGRLQVRGGPERTAPGNETHFTNNRSGSGGAIFVDGNTDPEMSPVIGGSDVTPLTRNYGFDIKFVGNTATAFGGAIYTARNMSIVGAGGVEANSLIGYGGNYPVIFENNKSGFGGGAITIHVPQGSLLIPSRQKAVELRRVQFVNNTVGEGVADINKPFIRGGGAIYSINADLNVVKGVQFIANKVYNGNGGAIAMVNPETNTRRYFVSDVDNVVVDPATLLAVDFQSTNDVFTWQSTAYPPDTRMLTQFLDNEVIVEEKILQTQSGSGTTQVEKGTETTVNKLYDVAFFDMTSGFAVGQSGTIIKITQGGDRWQYNNYSQPYRLMSVTFRGNLGFIAGDRGVILKTDNNGGTWREVNPAIYSYALNDIYFPTTNVGFAVGSFGTILKTTDAGETWVQVGTGVTNNNLRAVYFVSATRGFAVGDLGTIIMTTDGGSTWDVRFANTYASLRDVYFTDLNTGYAVGHWGVILKTNNGGASWDKIVEDLQYSFNKIVFTSANIGYVFGEYGLAWKTTNAGTNWTPLNVGTNYSIYSAVFPTSQWGVIAGDYGLLKRTLDGGNTWNDIKPSDARYVDVVRKNWDTDLPENGVGLGGAIYILDVVDDDRANRVDSIFFNRVRIQNNKAFTGAAVYSDNYNLRLVFNRSLITGNEAYSKIGYDMNVISGPLRRDNNRNIVANSASSDLAGAILYGEIVGPLPSHLAPEAANSIYNNKARFLIRLPDAPNTKGVLSGKKEGFGGTDTLRGNYWGRTEANVVLSLVYQRKIIAIQGTDTIYAQPALMETFFVDSEFNPKNETYMKFMFPQTADPREQGPFESIHKFTYRPIPLQNGADENTPGQYSIPEKVLMSGLVYDLYDKGTDIKVADYSNRRMVPIEDFAVGIPPRLRTFNVPGFPSFGKYVKRWIRDPFVAEARDANGQLIYPFIAAMQDEFRPDEEGNYYHPIGYPLFLEAQSNYEGLAERSNHDPRLLNETVFFIINETTGDYIRVPLKQVDENAPYREIFRARVELVPDSSARNPNTTIRRTEEGLYNLGVGAFLLRQLRFQPEREDRGALLGRRYHASTTGLGSVPNLFSNRPVMPPSNQGNQTFYAGERYRALPVNAGDIVRVVSRTVLWREGEVPAFDKGISFRIVRSTEPPVFTGNMVKLQKDTIVKIVPSEFPSRRGMLDTLKLVEFLHTIFLTEDREYPQYKGTYSDLAPEEGQGRDSIAAVTAMDTNKYFDPRSFLQPNRYSRLTYHWNVDPTTALARWLLVDTIPAGDQTVLNPKDNALGYIVFRGRPINPYVVPGGEWVTVRAENYPPAFRVIDSLRAIGAPQDTIDKFIYIFAPYLNAYRYDVTNARYLQQDTIHYGGQYFVEYSFRIFVIDSIPRFMDWVATEAEADAQAETIYKRIDRAGTNLVPYVIYKPSVYTCGMTTEEEGNKLKANLTNKLRFQVDFNTDDELEDLAAETLEPRGWDFRFGKTAYGFMNIAIRNRDWWGGGGDTTVIDTTTYDQNKDGIKNEQVITQTRPVWMGNQYLMKYGTDGTADPFGVDLTTRGQINIRIDSSVAWDLLKPSQPVRYNQALNTDTVFTIVVNDGHGGINFMTMPVFINVAPIIITESLPPAKEDVDYNPQLIDSSKAIKVFDPNFGQTHEFELIYPEYPLDSIPRDPCFPEAGYWNISNLKTTPRWLKINPTSGLLYGTPGVKDAPRTEQVVVAVWDIVGDERQLSAIKVLSLFVDSTNHKPRITNAPKVRCVDIGKSYEDTLYVWDYDLRRGRVPGDPTEELTLRVIRPAGFTIEPSVIRGIRDKDTVKVLIKTTAFPDARDPDGKVSIFVEVTDASGARDTLIYRVQISAPTDFVCTLRVENTFPGNIPGDGKSAWQLLYFGTAPRDATTGDGLDGEAVGTLDAVFCEYELPAIPPIDVFDARWSVPLTNGTHRNIFPRARNLPDFRIYKGRFQAGGVVGNTSTFYPVSIRWRKDEIPDKNDAQRNPTGSQWFIRDDRSNGNIFNYNMKTGEGYPKDGDIRIIDEGQYWRVQIGRDVVAGFLIVHDWISNVEQLPGVTFGISQVSPNPVSNTARVSFGINTDGFVKIELVDALGKVVSTIVSGYYTQGQYTEYWEVTNEVANGVYFLRLTSGTDVYNYPVNIIR